MVSRLERTRRPRSARGGSSLDHGRPRNDPTADEARYLDLTAMHHLDLGLARALRRQTRHDRYRHVR